MANEQFTRGETEWVASPKITTKNNTIISIPTKNKFLDKNISITPSISEAEYDLRTSLNITSNKISTGFGIVTKSDSQNLFSNLDIQTEIKAYPTATLNIDKSGWIGGSSSDEMVINPTPEVYPVPSYSSEKKYLAGVMLQGEGSFTIDDGIYNWTITKDADGNVSLV